MKLNVGIIILLFIVLLIFSINGVACLSLIPNNPGKEDRLYLNDNFKLKDKDTYIIFLSGLDTYCDGMRYNNMRFEHVRRRLSSIGLAFKDERFLNYSYQGGRVDQGRWHPNPYTPADTGQPIEYSVLYLAQMINDFQFYHPGARFILVGHSLGGRIAFDYILKYQADNPGPIKGVITINSPLTGLPYSDLSAFSMFHPTWGSVAVRQLIREYQLQDEFADLRLAKAEKARSKGIRIAAFGTRQDLIVRPFTSYLVDKRGNPLFEGGIVSVPRSLDSRHSLLGHRAILKDPVIADYVIAMLLSKG